MFLDGINYCLLLHVCKNAQSLFEMGKIDFIPPSDCPEVISKGTPQDDQICCSLGKQTCMIDHQNHPATLPFQSRRWRHYHYNHLELLLQCQESKPNGVSRNFRRSLAKLVANNPDGYHSVSPSSNAAGN
ncbi:hypothetical protein ACH5RR_022526 [Cinchona calisaya]|uniref:Uncharacterized protein n=1 Tax=Cinchona calisaya TaxID=153742 RepID=A0ABD2Z819_9GENT